MDKRKASGGGAAEELDDRAAKRRKVPAAETVDLSAGETVETTTQLGLKLVSTFRQTADKSGRLIATAFLKLPSKRDLPEYYDVIQMPIALDTIEEKLKHGDFPTLTTLESYFKRMISNAKEFNEKGSEIYEDSERLRKALSNFMTKHNPAYKTPGYSAFPTPLPGTPLPPKAIAALSAKKAAPTPKSSHLDGTSDLDADGEEDPDAEPTPAAKRKLGRGRPPKNTPDRKPSTTPALSEWQYADVSFTKLTFQQAQEKIVEDLIRKKEFESDDFAHFEPFIVLPPKSLRDYYSAIKNPVSLSTLQNRIKGGAGKKATGISDFKSWATFEDEASRIWKNAREYNEDGSPIFVLAGELQKFFNKELAQAKAAVSEPTGTKIKLKMPESERKITLKFGGKASPAASPAPQSAPQANGTNGSGGAANGTTRRNPFGSSQSSATPAPNLGQLERARSSSTSVQSPTTSNPGLVKNEEVARNSPAVQPINNYRASSQAVSTPGLSGMAPPSTPGVTGSNTYSQGGYAQSFNHVAPHQVNPSFDSKWRQPGKDASGAMITNLSLATHPGLNLSRHFRMDIPPSPTMAQQSITITLPPTHYYLQLKPTIAAHIVEGQYKLFVTSGTTRLPAQPLIPGHPVDNCHPLFETRLAPGLNRIEVELIAALPKGSKSASGQDAELEKITIFANLTRA